MKKMYTTINEFKNSLKVNENAINKQLPIIVRMTSMLDSGFAEWVQEQGDYDGNPVRIVLGNRLEMINVYLKEYRDGMKLIDEVKKLSQDPSNLESYIIDITLFEDGNRMEFFKLTHIKESIGYRAKSEDIIWLDQEQMERHDFRPGQASKSVFKSTNGLCDVMIYARQNGKRGYAYVTIHTKLVSGYNVDINSIKEINKLLNDLQECKTFIETSL